MTAQSAPSPPPVADGIEPSPNSNLPSRFMGMVMAAIAVAALYFGRPVLIPLALAILLAFALAPVAGVLRTRLHFNRAIAVIMTMLMAIVVVGGLGVFIGTQVSELGAELPRYQTNLSQKVQSIRGGGAASGIFARLSKMVDNLGNQIQSPPPRGATGTASKPMVVEIHEPAPTPIEVVTNYAGPLLDLLATTAIVMVFAAFLLLQKEDLRDRLVRLAGGGDLHRTTTALDDGATRLSRFLLAQTAVNASFGIFISIVLFFLGVPNPGLWGLIVAILRFIPYVGVPLAALFPTLLALAVDPGWALAIWTLGVFLVTEAIVGQIIEPLIYGRSIGLSTVAIVVAATFWTWLWGPVGLLLSTPLTMCLLVVGRHVEALNFLDVLLGDKPALEAEESFYLRLLAGDADGAAAIADAYPKDKPGTWHDHVALRALTLAQADANRGALDPERQERIMATIQGVIENLRDDTALAPAVADKNGKKAEAAPKPVEPVPVLCLAARGALDEAAALLLADLLARKSVRATVAEAHDASYGPAGAETTGIKIVCVSYLEPSAWDNARYLLRRLSKRLPGAPVIVGFWCFHDQDSRYLDAVEATRHEGVVTNFEEATTAIVTALNVKNAPRDANAAVIAQTVDAAVATAPVPTPVPVASK